MSDNSDSIYRGEGRLIKALIWFLYRTPDWLTGPFIRLTTFLGLLSNSRNTKVSRRNLEICFAQKDQVEIEQLVRDSAKSNEKLATEFARAWYGDKKLIQSSIGNVSGEESIQSIQKLKQPLIIAVPHIGNWEFFWHWLQLNYKAISMYTPAQYKALDELMLNARTRFGGKPFATDPKGIMGLTRALKKGGIMMILPDQVPKSGGGCFAPFFGKDAYTMTLLHKFIAKTGAQLVFGSCIRQDNGKFDIYVENAQFDYSGLEAEHFNKAMNGQIETIVERNPEQYQWNYKRFKRQPDNSNPYQF
ncbi:MAG: lysophospholipid acyltransferase family protein [Kangiellaceae bacterium]|nr:lysophospholipid acyltransferase family protein [Kangiellaceae bacterium]